jgi:hypothetical protein
MKRTWLVRADMDDGTVSREAILAALMDGEAMLARAGGVLTVIVQREPTRVPMESVTTAAIFEWKHHPEARPNVEHYQRLVPDEEELLPADPDPDVLEDHLEHLAREERLGEALTDNPDGFPMETLEEEDVDSIPQGAR